MSVEQFDPTSMAGVPLTNICGNDWIGILGDFILIIQQERSRKCLENICLKLRCNNFGLIYIHQWYQKAEDEYEH